MASVIKKATMDALVSALDDALPDSLGIEVKAGAADFEETTPCAGLRILPGKFEFVPFQDDELDDSEEDTLLLSVGEFVGTVELRATSPLKLQRELVEDAVINAFLQREFSPGVIVATTNPVIVGGVITTYAADVAFVLDSSEWRDELVFSKKRHTFLEIEASYPALILRNAYTIESLITAFNNDLDSDVPVEAFEVQEDGTSEQSAL